MMSKETIEMVRQDILSRHETSDNYTDYGVEFMETKDAGTAHINILHPSGDAIAVTASINFLLVFLFLVSILVI